MHPMLSKEVDKVDKVDNVVEGLENVDNVDEVGYDVKERIQKVKSEHKLIFRRPKSLVLNKQDPNHTKP